MTETERLKRELEEAYRKSMKALIEAGFVFTGFSDPERERRNQ